MALHIMELAEIIASGKGSVSISNGIVNIPLLHLLHLLGEPSDIEKKAYKLLLRNHPEQIWESIGVKQQKMEELWPSWIEGAKTWFAQRYPNIDPPDKLVYEPLFKDLTDTI